MSELLVYGSEDCMGWEDVEDLLDELKSDPDCNIEIDVRDPAKHWEEFQDKGLVVCPSFLFNDELIAVGPQDPDDLKEIITAR